MSNGNEIILVKYEGDCQKFSRMIAVFDDKASTYNVFAFDKSFGVSVLRVKTTLGLDKIRCLQDVKEVRAVRP